MLSACSIDLHMEDDTLSFSSAGEVAEQGPSQWLSNCEVAAEPWLPHPWTVWTCVITWIPVHLEESHRLPLPVL